MTADPIQSAGWLTVAQAAQRLGVTRARADVWRREGRLPAVWSETAQRWLIPADQCERPEPRSPGRPRASRADDEG